MLDGCVLPTKSDLSSRGIRGAGVAASIAAGNHALWHITASVEQSNVHVSFWTPSTPTAAQIAASALLPAGDAFTGASWRGAWHILSEELVEDSGGKHLLRRINSQSLIETARASRSVHLS